MSLDFGADGQVIAVEVLAVSRRMAAKGSAQSAPAAAPVAGPAA